MHGAYPLELTLLISNKSNAIGTKTIYTKESI